MTGEKSSTHTPQGPQSHGGQREEGEKGTGEGMIAILADQFCWPPFPPLSTRSRSHIQTK